MSRLGLSSRARRLSRITVSQSVLLKSVHRRKRHVRFGQIGVELERAAGFLARAGIPDLVVLCEANRTRSCAAAVASPAYASA